MRIGSLFSGSGMLDLAVAAFFGGEVVWQAEHDKHASRVLAAHFPDIPNLGEISTVDWNHIPAVDVLCGGFPCQDVSTAGNKAGIVPGTRSGTWTYMAEAIGVLRPQYVVIENVRGLRSAKAHRPADLESCPMCLGVATKRPLRALGAVLGDLAALGYNAQWGSVRASDAGAPHQRDRVFILATNASGRQLTGTASAWHGVPVTTECGDCATAHTCGQRRGREQNGPVVGRMGAAPESFGRQERAAWQISEHRSATATADADSTSSQARGDARRDGEQSRQESVGRAAPTLDWGIYTAAIERWEYLTGVPAPVPAIDNKLNPDLAEWMMGWPIGWTDVGLSRPQRLKVCGNGVVPQQALLALQLLSGELA